MVVVFWYSAGNTNLPAGFVPTFVSNVKPAGLSTNPSRPQSSMETSWMPAGRVSYNSASYAVVPAGTVPV